MEECGRGAAVEQLTARGMVSIPAMGGNRHDVWIFPACAFINPRNGGAIVNDSKKALLIFVSIPAMGAIEHRAFSARYFNNRYGVYEGLLLIQKCKGFYLILCYFNDTIPILMKFTWHGNI